MSYCRKCGKPVNESDSFCASCGEKIENGSADAFYKAGEKFAEANNTPDTTESFDENDIKDNKVLAVFAYLGILVLIPILAAPKSKFSKFHANQGLVLLIAEVIFFTASAIVSTILGLLLGFIGVAISYLLTLIGLVFPVLTVIGIINVINGKAKELPVIGGIKILKY